MKKIYLISLTALLLLTSCSIGNNSDNNQTSIEPTQPQPTSEVIFGKPDKRFAADGFVMDLFYRDDGYDYYGTHQVPNPCYETKVEISISESYPEQVNIDIEAKNINDSDSCIQVVATNSFSGSFQVSRVAELGVIVNGKLAEDIEPKP